MKKTKEQLIAENDELYTKISNLRNKNLSLESEVDELNKTIICRDREVRRLTNQVHYLAGMLMHEGVVITDYDYGLDVRVNVEISKEEKDNYDKNCSTFTYCNKE